MACVFCCRFLLRVEFATIFACRLSKMSLYSLIVASFCVCCVLSCCKVIVVASNGVVEKANAPRQSSDKVTFFLDDQNPENKRKYYKMNLSLL